MFTKTRLPTDGTTGPFTIGFNYLNGNTVSVYRLDTASSTPVQVGFTFVGTKSENQPQGTSIVLQAAIPVGSFIEITKLIDMDTPVIQWNSGTELTQNNLRKSTVNAMEMSQAAYDLAQHADDNVQYAVAAADQITSIIPANVLAVGAQVAADKTATATSASQAQAAVTAITTRLQATVALDFGSYAVESVFTVNVPGLSVGTYVRVDMTAVPQGSRYFDEAEMDMIVCTAYVSAANTLTIFAKSMYGPVHGRYTFALTY